MYTESRSFDFRCPNSITSSSVKVKMIDIIHLADASTITGEIIESIPDVTIKIKIVDGQLITYLFN